MKIAFDNAHKGMSELIPALALMAPAFWVAWIELIYSGEIYLSPSQPTSFQIIVNYAISTTALSLSLMLFAHNAQKTEALIGRTWVTPAAGAGAAVATLWCLLAPSPVATAITGVFTSVLVLRFSVIYSQFNPKASMVAIVLSQMVASFVYGYVLALPLFWRPVFMCLLPLIAGVCSMFDGESAPREEIDEKRKPNAGFIRFVCALVLFSIALNVVRGFYPSSIEMDAFSDARGNSSVLFFFAKMAFALFVILLPLKANLGKLSYYGFVGLAILALPLPLLGLQSPEALELFGCVNALLNIVVWSLFAGIAYKSGRSPIRLMGYGWGFMSLGSVIGWLLGLGLYAAGFEREQIAFVEVALLAIMLLACVFVVTWQVVDALFDPFDSDSDECVDRTLGANANHEREKSSFGDASCHDTIAMSGVAAEAQASNASAKLVSDASKSADPEAFSLSGLSSMCAECSFSSCAEKTAMNSLDGLGEFAMGIDSGASNAAGASNDAEDGESAAQAEHSAKGRWRRAVFEMATDKELSDREADVMELLLKGYSKQRVAEELFIAYNTVRSHVRKVYVKCDVHSQQELIDLFERDYLRR